MSFVAQKELAKGDITCDVQYGSRSEVMQLEDVVLQEPAEEWMDWKSEAPQQVRDKAYLLPLDGLGKLSACSPPS